MPTSYQLERLAQDGLVQAVLIRNKRIDHAASRFDAIHTLFPDLEKLSNEIDKPIQTSLKLLGAPVDYKLPLYYYEKKQKEAIEEKEKIEVPIRSLTKEEWVRKYQEATAPIQSKINNYTKILNNLRAKQFPKEAFVFFLSEREASDILPLLEKNAAFICKQEGKYINVSFKEGSNIEEEKTFLRRIQENVKENFRKTLGNFDISTQELEIFSLLKKTRATKQQIENAVENLFAAGQTLEITDKEGKTPIHYAIVEKEGRKDIVELLVRKGAKLNEVEALIQKKWPSGHKVFLEQLQKFTIKPTQQSSREHLNLENLVGNAKGRDGKTSEERFSSSRDFWEKKNGKIHVKERSGDAVREPEAIKSILKRKENDSFLREKKQVSFKGV